MNNDAAKKIKDEAMQKLEAHKEQFDKLRKEKPTKAGKSQKRKKKSP